MSALGQDDIPARTALQKESEKLTQAEVKLKHLTTVCKEIIEKRAVKIELKPMTELLETIEEKVKAASEILKLTDCKATEKVKKLEEAGSELQALIMRTQHASSQVNDMTKNARLSAEREKLKPTVDEALQGAVLCELQVKALQLDSNLLLEKWVYGVPFEQGFAAATTFEKECSLSKLEIEREVLGKLNAAIKVVDVASPALINEF